MLHELEPLPVVALEFLSFPPMGYQTEVTMCFTSHGRFRVQFVSPYKAPKMVPTLGKCPALTLHTISYKHKCRYTEGAHVNVLMQDVCATRFFTCPGSEALLSVTRDL